MALQCLQSWLGPGLKEVLDRCGLEHIIVCYCLPGKAFCDVVPLEKFEREVLLLSATDTGML